MTRYVPGRFWQIVLVILLIAVLTVYFATTIFLRPKLEDYVRSNLPEAIKTRDISFRLLPLTVNLEESTVRTEPERSLSVESIQVNPNLRSLFGDTFVIDTLEFEGITLSFYRSGTADTASIEASGIDSLFGSEGPGANFRINRLILSRGTIQLLESPGSTSPVLDFSPIHASVGPITPATLKNGISIDAVSGFQGVEERIFLQGTLKTTPGLSLEGELRLDKFRPDNLPDSLLPGVRFAGGNLRGTIRFDYRGESLSLPSINVDLNKSSLEFPASATVEEVLATDEPPTNSGATPSWLSIGEIQLGLSDITVDPGGVISQREPTPLIINEGLIKTGSYTGVKTPVPVLGQFLLARPTGLFEFKTDLNLNRDPYRFENVLSDVRIDDVNQLNPYLGTILPVRLKSGSMTGAMKGEFSSEKLDLAVELDFNNLKMGSATSDNSTFLGVPVKVYLNSLSKNNGNLELSFRLNGSPASPNLEISSIRNRILVNLGVEAAVLSSLGLPVYLGEKVVERVTGVSLINEAKSAFSTIFQSPKAAENPPILKPERRKTPLPARKRSNGLR